MIATSGARGANVSNLVNGGDPDQIRISCKSCAERALMKIEPYAKAHHSVFPLVFSAKPKAQDNMANFMQSLDISTQDVWTLFTPSGLDLNGVLDFSSHVCKFIRLGFTGLRF